MSIPSLISVLLPLLLALAAPGSAQILGNPGFESGYTGWTTSPGAGVASFTTPGDSPYVGAQYARIEVTATGAPGFSTLTANFTADAKETYLLRWFAKVDVNRAGMKIQVTSSGGPAYSQATFDPSSNGWEAYHFAFKASGATTVTFTFEENAVYGLDELQVYDTDSPPDFTGTSMDPERHFLWRWGQASGAGGALTNTDNDVSVELPDGRVAWIFNDTYTGNHDPYDNGSFYNGFVRNFLVIQDGDSLTPWTPGATSFTPGPAGNIYWPTDAFVVDDKLKIILHEIESGGGGPFLGSAVATLSLPGLTLDGISGFTPIHVLKVLDAGDGHLYLYGGNSGPGDEGIARVPKADLDSFASWEYWNGSSWVTDPNAAVLIGNLDGMWSVSRIGPDNFMASIAGFVGSTFRASFASSPAGPWTPSVEIGRPPGPFEAETAYYYMPYMHDHTVQNGIYSIGFSDIGPSGADGDGPFLSNRPGEDQCYYNIQYFLTPDLLELSPHTGDRFGDDFSDNDPVEWQTYGGTWTAAGGEFGVAPGPGPKAVAVGVVTGPTVVEARVTADGGDAGLIFRGSDYRVGADNLSGYYAGIDPGSGVVLGRMDNGSWTELDRAPMAIPDGVPHHLRVLAEGDSIRVFVDDMVTPRIDWVDATYDSGSTGLRAFFSDASWDDFAVAPIPEAPTGLAAVAGSNRVGLSWDAVDGAEFYEVRRSTSSGGPYAPVATGLGDPAFTDEGALNGTTYHYVVVAANGVIAGAPSGEVSATPSLSPPPFLHLRMDDAAGLEASDSSGNGWNASLENGPVWSPGRINGALGLDGGDDRATLPAGVVSGLSDLTVATWVFWNGGGDWQRIFDFGTGRGAGDSYMILTPRRGGGVASFEITASGAAGKQVIDAPAALPTGAWTHVAVTLSGSVGRLYIGGVEVGSNPGVTLNPSDMGATDRNWLGDSQYGSDPGLNGLLDEFQIHARALSPGEIADLASPPAAPTGPAAEPGASGITVTWNAVPGADAYFVKRAPVPGGPHVDVSGPVLTTSFLDTAVTPGGSYHYVVTAIRSVAESGNSAEVDSFALTAKQAWRLEHFGTWEDTGDAADDEDPDGDGSRNCDEFTAGTDPNDGSSVFRILEVIPGGDHVLIRFPTVSGKTYGLEWSTQLSTGTWTVVVSGGVPQDSIAGTGGVIEVVHDEGPVPGKGFYRGTVSE